MAEYGPGTFSTKHGRDWVRPSEKFAEQGSEYGGVEGLIQPFPHDVKTLANEQLMLLYNTDPADEVSGTDLPPMPTVKKYNE